MGDCRRELNELGRREVAFEATEQLVGHISRCSGHRNSKVKDEPLHFREGGAIAVARQVMQLLLRNAFRSADGRVHVDSTGTPDEDSGFELRKGSEASVNPSCSFERKFVEGPSEKEAWCVCSDPPGVGETSDSPANTSEDQSSDPASFAVCNTRHARHGTLRLSSSNERRISGPRATCRPTEDERYTRR